MLLCLACMVTPAGGGPEAACSPACRFLARLDVSGLVLQVEEEMYQLRPMNCPFHIAVYKHKQYSYRDLPLRYAELGTVYRYERSGTMHGLFRVRGFTQVGYGRPCLQAFCCLCGAAGVCGEGGRRGGRARADLYPARHLRKALCCCYVVQDTSCRSGACLASVFLTPWR